MFLVLSVIGGLIANLLYDLFKKALAKFHQYLANMTGTSYRIKETKKIKSDKSCIINFLYICSSEGEDE